MKLLVISQYFYPEQFRVTDVCFKLASMGHDITVLTGLPNYPAGNIFDGYHWKTLKMKGNQGEDSSKYFPHLKLYQEQFNGVRVLRCRLYPRKRGKRNLAFNYLSYAYFAAKAAKAIAKENSMQFDKILVFQYSPVTMVIPGIILKKRLHLPLIIYCFDLWPESIVAAGVKNHGLVYDLLRLLSRWIYKQADTLLISSKNFKKYFSEKLQISDNIHYLPIYAEDLYSEVKSDTSGKTNLLFAGNIGDMQSIETIVKAANHVRNHPDIHFHIVGDGSALERNMRYAEELKLDNITFHGRHPLEDMPEYYKMADAFLVTLKKDDSISYTLPGKVQSYMAAGKPIIAAIDGETYDVIQRANSGLCCPAEDDKGLAEIIVRFSEDKENRHIYGDNAKSYYKQHFTSEAFFHALLEHLM